MLLVIQWTQSFTPCCPFSLWCISAVSLSGALLSICCLMSLTMCSYKVAFPSPYTPSTNTHSSPVFAYYNICSIAGLHLSKMNRGSIFSLSFIYSLSMQVWVYLLLPAESVCSTRTSSLHTCFLGLIFCGNSFCISLPPIILFILALLIQPAALFWLRLPFTATPFAFRTFLYFYTFLYPNRCICICCWSVFKA